MAEIIGQAKLRAALDKYTLETLPKTIMLIGEAGCGKHLLAKNLASRLKLDLVTIDEKVTHEQLIEFEQKTINTLYLLEVSKFTEKQQNQFLKFIEEPAESVYIILIAETETGILPTIVNRCLKYHFEAYTEAELKKFNPLSNSTIYNICRTPGSLKDLDIKNMAALETLCANIVASIGKASYANAISISTKINYKEEYNKFDFKLFFNTLAYKAFEDYKNTKNELSFTIYLITNKYIQELLKPLLVKETFMINFLTELWKGTR